jgi:hypothetical protein
MYYLVTRYGDQSTRQRRRSRLLATIEAAVLNYANRHRPMFTAYVENIADNQRTGRKSP